MFYITPLYVVWRNSNFLRYKNMYTYIISRNVLKDVRVIFKYIDTYVCTYISKNK